jgi:hypothetical protein
MDFLDANFLTLMWFFVSAIPAFFLACIIVVAGTIFFPITIPILLFVQFLR